MFSFKRSIIFLMKQKSFTLIEILVVIVVIGVLSAFILVGMSSISSNANIAKSKTFTNSLRNSLLMSLVAEWKLDGNTNDSWGTYNGTNNGATPTPSNCADGSCYSFNGTSNFIEIFHNTNLRPTNEITFSVWASTTDWSTISDKRIISCTETGGFNIAPTVNTCSASIYINAAYRALNFYTTAPASGWHFFLATYDNRYFKIYFDGKYVSQYDAGATYPIVYTYTNSLIIGGESGYPTGCAGNYFNGLIDTVALYNKTMPSSNIKEKYYSGLNKLFRNNSIALKEFNQRLVELKNNLTNNE
jgi:prepilin-type N-terminal cleavage/methylation domain-containing protein